MAHILRVKVPYSGWGVNADVTCLSHGAVGIRTGVCLMRIAFFWTYDGRPNTRDFHRPILRPSTPPNYFYEISPKAL
jgi:hypothetical protein